MVDKVKEFLEISTMCTNRSVKQELDWFLFDRKMEEWILNYYQINDFMEQFSLKDHIRRFFNPEIESRYPECSLAMKYNFTLYQLITQTEMDSYIERFDVIKDPNISQEVRGYIINSYRKKGYPYGLRIRRADEKYVIYWDKIQINGLDFQDLGFNYFKELRQNGIEKQKKK